jgi:RNA polymerase sigma-70 factor (ECF subfamily)
MADRKDFESIALPHLDALYRAALAMSGKPDRAEDLVQTTVAKALVKFESFRTGSNCRAWLMRILHNTWVDQLRHRKVVGTTLPVEEQLLAEPQKVEPTTWSNAEDMLDNFSDQQVIRALSDLPPDQRLTLYLIDVEQLSQEEVADITSVAVGTVKSRTSRGRRTLRTKLDEYAREMGLVGRRDASDG